MRTFVALDHANGAIGHSAEVEKTSSHGFDHLSDPECSIESTKLKAHRSRLLRRIDARLLSMMLITYGLQFLEKSVFGYGAVYNLRADNHLSGSDYSWVTSVFYFGYLAGQFPLSAAMAYFEIRHFLGLTIICWGITLLTTNFSSSFAGLVTSRFLLGFFESVIPPAFIVVTARWYRREEQPIRQVVWYCGIPVFGTFGALVGYGLGYSKYLSPWRALFILFGGVAFTWGLIMFFFFPDDPAQARWLSDEDRQDTEINMFLARSGTKKWKWGHFRESLVDPKTYLFFLIGLSYTIPSGVLSNYSSLLVESFGFSRLQTLVLGIPEHVVQIVAMIGSGLLVTYVKNITTYVMALNCIPPIIGTVLINSLPHSNKWGRLVSVWIVYTHTTLIALSFAIIGGNVGGYTKKATVAFILFIGYCVGNIVSPHFFKQSQEAQGYPTGIKALLGAFAASFVLSLILRVLYIVENKRRDRLGYTRRTVDGDSAGVDDDLTDIQDKSFRYTL